jgi:hypothetical protein
MLERSPFLQAAVRKPWYSYLTMLARVSPIHLLGLFLGVATVEIVLRRGYHRLLAGGWVLMVMNHINTWVDRTSKKVNAWRLNSASYKAMWRRAAHTSAAMLAHVLRHTEVRPLDHKENDVKEPTVKPGEATVWMLQQMQQQELVDLLQSVDVRIAVFTLWPIGFLLGHTMLGCCGGTFQTRFILPILPATSVLAASYVARTGKGRLSGKIEKTSTVTSNFVLGGDTAAAANTTRSAVCAMLLCYGAMHTLFYGVLYGPMFADLDFSVVGIVAGILRTTYYAPPDRDTFEIILKFMEHFGLARKAA